MLDTFNINDIINKIKTSETVDILSGIHPIQVHFSPDTETLVFKTSVYQGYNFIPFSVRDCLVERPRSTHTHLATFLYVNEDDYRVSLHYRGNAEDLEKDRFPSLIEEFEHVAEEWRRVLDDYDKRDLIHVKVP